VFADIAYAFNNNFESLLVVDELWRGDKRQFNSVKGGLTLQAPGHLFAFIGSTVLTNLRTTPFVSFLIATPKGHFRRGRRNRDGRSQCRVAEVSQLHVGWRRPI